MIATMMVLPPEIEGGYLLLLTEKGYIKKLALSQFDNLHGTVRTRSAIKLRVRARSQTEYIPGVMQTLCCVIRTLCSTPYVFVYDQAGDRLLAVAQCCDDSEVVLCASCGTGIRFTATQDELREVSRMHGGLTVRTSMGSYCLQTPPSSSLSSYKTTILLTPSTIPPGNEAQSRLTDCGHGCNYSCHYGQ